MTLPLAFLFKIAVPPVLVALMSLAARRWGATVGGLIMGLPWMTGPVLLFLGLDKGEAFAVKACLGIELAVLSMVPFILAFGFTSRWRLWPVSLAAAIAAYAGTATLSQDLDLPLWLASGFGAAALIFAFCVLPTPAGVPTAPRLPWWDIPARMAATAMLVTGIMLSADRLGPQLSGIVASFPVILTVIGSFTLSQGGRDATLRVLKGISLSLLSFVAFFVVVGYAVPHVGLLLAFAAAALIAILISAAIIAASRMMQRKL